MSRAHQAFLEAALAVPEDGVDQRFLTVEIAIQGSHADSGLRGDGRYRRAVQAMLSKHPQRGLDDLVAFASFLVIGRHSPVSEGHGKSHLVIE